METEDGHPRERATVTDPNACVAEQTPTRMRLSPERKIDLLLREYDALRNEIAVRVSSNYIVLSCFVVLAAAFVGIVKDFSWRAGITGGVATVGLFFVWWNQLRYMFVCSERVAEIEEEVNRIVGEDVLVWDGKRSTGRKYRWLFPGKF
jgi:hypothetical protein